MVTDELLTYSEGQWVQALPPMPTARFFSSVLSVKSVLIVGGGCIQALDQPNSTETDVVEVLSPDKSQWYRSYPLPQPCRYVSLLSNDNMCYVIGGYRKPLSLNQASYTSVDKLLNHGHAVTSGDSIWKSVSNTPGYGPAAVTLAGHLLTIGGHKKAEGGYLDRKDEVYMYSSCLNSWILISRLPVPRCDLAAVRLSATEVWVIGGWGESRLNSVVKLKLN